MTAPPTQFIHRSHLRLHAQCPKCGKYRSNSILTDGKDKIILVCECEHEGKTDGEAKPGRNAESLLF